MAKCTIMLHHHPFVLVAWLLQRPVHGAVDRRHPGWRLHGLADRDDPAVAVDYGIDRLVCGHYYHDKCLAEWMMNPPFDKKCHVCSQPVRHHKYSESAEKLEARWAKRQERLREMDEVASLMGL